jgi:CheY-like chemotaxis protein
MLEGAGQELLVVRNGYEALTVAKRQRGVIDLLSTDIVMPRMNGFELGEQIGSGLPETNVLFLSGFFKGSTAVRNGLGAAGRAPRSPEMPPLYPYGP